MKRREYTDYISDAVRIKALWSQRECMNMNSKPVRCPHCNFTMIHAYEDVKGHYRMKCPKCKNISDMTIDYAQL